MHMKYLQNNYLLLYFTCSVEEDIELLRKNGGLILICTPGRLEDLLTRKSILNLPGMIKNLVGVMLFYYLD